MLSRTHGQLWEKKFITLHIVLLENLLNSKNNPSLQNLTELLEIFTLSIAFPGSRQWKKI